MLFFQMSTTAKQEGLFQVTTPLTKTFIVSAYFPDQDGKLRPAIPDVCPYHFLNNNMCQLNHDHFRDRKTGPCFPLAVIRCQTHKKGFTIYPWGHVPYGRKQIAPVTPDGSLIINGKGEHRFEGTYFDAALDAATKHVWPHEDYKGNLHPRYRTQMRHLDRTTLLLGIEPDIDEHLREETAQIISVPGQLLYDSVSLIKEKPGYQAMGSAICTILKAIPNMTSIFERIAEAGAVAALWSSPDLWDCEHNILKESKFRRIRTRASP